MRNISRFMKRLDWALLSVIGLVLLLGTLVQIDADGGFDGGRAQTHVLRVVVAFIIMIAVACVPIRYLYRSAYAVMFITIVMLVAVLFVGSVGMGAQRWLPLIGFSVQPSEFAKIALILTLARYYHGRSFLALHTLKNLFIPCALIGGLMGLVALQPDLGTTISFAVCGAVMMIAAGVSFRFFFGMAGLTLLALPFVWKFGLHSYQKARVTSFLNPENDPLGTGYHVIQSKIALGSSGFWGKGFLQGTQTHLKFLPEKHTDFAFTVLVEDFGLFGAFCLFTLYVLFTVCGLRIALRSESAFGSIAVVGVLALIWSHAIINMAMVMGLLPVVGIPLPFISYGGSFLLTLSVACGIMLNVGVFRNDQVAVVSRYRRKF